MKRILITGASSYIGNQLREWLINSNTGYAVTMVSLRNDQWKTMDFSIYDVIYHTAGIAHIKETPDNKVEYYRVNRDLCFEVASKAKRQQVKQFIFLSSISIYGTQHVTIQHDTKANPETHYARSKYEAEQLLHTLSSDDFIVSILRLPVVYGSKCKGNYTRLETFVRRVPIFPDIKNQRSMLYIDNLLILSQFVIDDERGGLFYPQNREYVCTGHLVELMARSLNKKVILSRYFDVLLNFVHIGFVKKLKASLVYDKCMSEYTREYRMYSLEESIIQIQASSVPCHERGEKEDR